MRAFLTGSKGFIGGHLTAHLKALGHEVFGCSRNACASPSDAILECDLFDPNSVSNALMKTRPDWIFHLAAQSFAPEAEVNPMETMKLNVMGSVNLAEAIATLPITPRLIYFSSAEVYGVSSSTKMPIAESVAPNPNGIYGQSKYFAELMLEQYRRHYKLNVVALRPCRQIGPLQSERFAASSFAKQIADIEAGRSEAVLKVGNLDVIRDFADVRDLVRAYVLLAEKGKSGEVYNVAPGSGRPVRDILDILLSLTDKKIRVESDPARVRGEEPKEIYLDSAKLKTETGWMPEIPLESTLRDILEVWRLTN